ncbi:MULTISPECIES: LysR substrate-binding domain-containing protein [Achromobacter]|jgi:DNA-binding transcriptional LysR family regulator|uniref:LysR family transcriptional regulator n=1 Tax=Alcaligenes xylosoxydans xylosoxydans TaxID=85698 RepID=A0A424WA29_ALCXX|nr:MULTISPECIES: LysR substrate-binding domain-containing protein [Achromobacter]MBC9905577.1 LysR family transcriptional regulator [Achromobacter xylosoxidans]MBD0871039.1 LysR family transcriptional regulator [Achromobacter xylosoxidans]MDH1300717.1 LysR substrate-binding domain-containing protein [Achromobacter sp. GD03932]QNP86285.1 LysR family transcriptional regulator [Achromobacter xylosoxidans]RPJ90018.1 LysR family transcriptional regulator [Achromobacter xylosoxidans]
MEIRQLRYFAVLAEELNFTRAAARLHISQPPLSLQIAQLERELEVKLFDRNNRRVTLTEAGEAFLNDVRALLASLKDATVRARAVDQGLAGRIEVGLSGSHFMGPVPALIARYKASHPQVSVLLNEMNPAAQLDALRGHRIDVSISRTAVDDEELQSMPLWPDPVVAVLPKGHPLSARKRLALGDLAGEAFVMLRQDTSAFARTLAETCARAGLPLSAAQTVAEVPAQLALVAAGLGVALVPRSACRHATDRIAVCTLPADIARAMVYAVTRRQGRRRALDTFLQTAAQMKEE